jgi:hypothetical protein
MMIRRAPRYRARAQALGDVNDTGQLNAITPPDYALCAALARTRSGRLGALILDDKRSMIHDAAGIGRIADHDAAGVGRSMIHDAAGIVGSMIHDAAGIGRSMIRIAWVGQGTTPDEPPHGSGNLWGFATSRGIDGRRIAALWRSVRVIAR